jgi:hypothetical protein
MDRFDELKKANPFYHQKVFKAEDLKRSVADWKGRMRFIFRPTCVQICAEENKVVFFKQKASGEILITKIEEFTV